MKNTTHTSIIFLFFSLLTACGSSELPTVKESPFIADESYSNEQALEGRPICLSTNWTTFEDERGREIAQYQCELAKVSEFYTGYKERQAKKAEKYLIHIPQNKAKIEALKPHLVKKKLALNSFEKNKDYQSLSIELYKSRPEGSIDYGPSVTEEKIIQMLEYSLELKANKPSAVDMLAYRLKDDIKNDEYQLNRWQTYVSDNQGKYDAIIADLENNYSITSAKEQWQWVIKEDSVQLVAGGLVLSHQDGHTSQRQFENAIQALGAALDQNIQTYNDYLGNVKLLK